MAITFVGSGGHVAGTGAISVPQPAGIAAGDVLLLVVETANEAVSVQMSGWTEVSVSPQGLGTAGGTAATRLAVYYRISAGDEVAVGIADSGNHTIAAILAFRGVDQTTPINALAADLRATDNTAVIFPSVTTTKDNCWILLIEAHALPDANSTAVVSGHTNANLSGITERLDGNTNAGNGGGLSLASGEKVTAGATGTSSAALTTSTIGAQITLALQPFVELQQLTMPADVASFTVAGQNAGVVRQFPALTAEASSFALGGQDALLFKGVTAAAAPVNFTVDQIDAAITASRKLTADAASFSAEAFDAGALTGRKLTADVAAFDVAGLSAGVVKGYRLTVEAASFTLAVEPASIGKSYKLLAEVAAFDFAAIDADLVADLKEAPQRPEVNGAEILWYEILGEPIPARDIAADSVGFDTAGIDAKLLYGRSVPAGPATEFTATGVDVTFRRTYSLKADLAEFSQAGQDALLKTARKLVSDVTSFAHAGQPAGVLYGRTVKADVGAYALSGVAMNFKFQRFLRPILAGLSVSGLDAVLRKAKTFKAEAGTLSVSGYFEPGYIDPGYFTSEAKLLRQYPLAANVGQYTMAITDTTFRKTKLFIVDGGSFGVAGVAARLLTARRMLAQTVGFASQAYDIGFAWQHVMRPQPGAFDLSGLDAAVKKIITLYADSGSYSLDGYETRPYFSSLSHAKDYVMRPMEIRSVARPAENRTVMRPAEDRNSSRQSEDRYTEQV